MAHPWQALAAAMIALSLARPVAADNDSQLWTEAGIRRGFGKRLQLSLDQHLRFDDDLSRVSAVMPEAGLDYEVKKWLELGVGYRLQYERDGSGDMVVRHRLHANGQLEADLEPLRLDYRLRFQEQIRDAGDLRHTVRNRIGAAWRGIKPWVPGASLELFHALYDGEPARLRKVRFTAGSEYELGDHELEVFYRLELPQDDPDDPTLHIVGLGYRASI